MSFNRYSIGIYEFHAKIGNIYYINANGLLKDGLRSLKIKKKKMYVIPEIKRKFECFVITRQNVHKVIELIPDLQAFFAPLLVKKIHKQKKWPTKLIIDERWYPFQQEGVEFAVSRRSAYIADEMGLGKTVQAIGWLRNCPFSLVLITCPNSVLLNWVNEIYTWAPEWVPLPLGSGEMIKSIVEDPDLYKRYSKVVMLASYSQIGISGDLFTNLGIEGVICDEAHYLKEMESQRTIQVHALKASGVQDFLLLSGTPTPNTARELYAQMSLITDEFGSYDQFCRRYCPPFEINTPNGTQIKYSTPRNLPELRERVAHYMIYRKKTSVFKELPPKRYQKLTLEIDNVLRTKWEQLCEEAQDYQLDPGKFATLRKEIGLYKAKKAVEWMVDNSNAEHPLVVFIIHKVVHDYLVEALTRRKITIASIVGSTPIEQRQANVEAFQRGEIQIIICSSAAKEGITLTRSSRLLQLERMWVPADEAQAAARIHRIGSMYPVIITLAHLNDSTDNFIVAKLAKKQKFIDEMFGKEMIDEGLLSKFLTQLGAS